MQIKFDGRERRLHPLHPLKFPAALLPCLSFFSTVSAPHVLPHFLFCATSRFSFAFFVPSLARFIFRPLIHAELSPQYVCALNSFDDEKIASRYGRSDSLFVIKRRSICTLSFLCELINVFANVRFGYFVTLWINVKFRIRFCANCLS